MGGSSPAANEQGHPRPNGLNTINVGGSSYIWVMGITAGGREVQIEFFSGQRATGRVFAQYDRFDLIEVFGQLIVVPHGDVVGC